MYQKLIHDIDPTINPAGVEASMRLMYGTLDHLSHEIFRRETAIARSCKEREPGYLRRTAISYGMTADYNRWQEKLTGKPPDPPPVLDLVKPPTRSPQ